MKPSYVWKLSIRTEVSDNVIGIKQLLKKIYVEPWQWIGGSVLPGQDVLDL